MDDDSFRDALSAVCTPVAIVTSIAGAAPHGTTVSAFCSLSLRPPLVLVSLDENSDLLSLIRQTRVYGVNVLERDQHELALRFARKGPDKFADVAWRLDHGLPRIARCGLWLACSVQSEVEGGDHVILTGLVRAAEHDTREPLLYAQRRFGTLLANPA